MPRDAGSLSVRCSAQGAEWNLRSQWHRPSVQIVPALLNTDLYYAQSVNVDLQLGRRKLAVPRPGTVDESDEAW